MSRVGVRCPRAIFHRRFRPGIEEPSRGADDLGCGATTVLCAVFTLLRSLRFFAIVPMLGIAAGLTAIVVSPQLGNVVTAYDTASTEVTLDQLDELGTRTLVFDKDGELISALFAENRELITLADIPDEVITTILVVEDEDFYTHRGINVRSTLRALRENVSAGGISQGGSTITQQLIKNLLVGDEQTLSRKLNEAVFAWRLENTASKDEILERYLNTVFFGAGAYGVQAAAEVYWGKEPQDLDWVEAATLAAAISAPSANDPTVNPEEAGRQREIVLKRLNELGHITDEELAEYKRAPLPSERQELEIKPQDYFLELVRLQLLSDFRLGATPEERRDAVERGGLRVHTTFDATAQAMAEQARDEVLPDDPRFTMAIAAIEPATGAVKAVVGGPGFDEVPFDITTNGIGRQPGSSMKPYVMVTLFEQGFQPNDTASGRGPCKFPGVPGAEKYTGNNFGKSAGSIGTIQRLTTSSSNCGFLRLGQVAGIENVIQTAKAMGIGGDLPPVLTLPLGAGEVLPMDHASAFGVMANGGRRNEPYLIERIETSDGELVFQQEIIPQQVISEQSACWATQILAANVTGGTGTAARLPNQVAAGKTGTTEEFSDAWFVGFTPYLTTAVWMGNPDEREPMRGVGGLGSVTGGSFPARAWGAFNKLYHENLEPVPFPGCPGFPRKAKFLRIEGDAEIFDPCPDAAALDTDNDGAADGCVDRTTDGLLACGQTDTVDEVGNPITVFCQAPHVQCPEGAVGVDTDGDRIRDQCGPAPDPEPETEPAPDEAPAEPPPPAAPVECGVDEVPADTTGDGIADTCLPTA